jgi:integrase
MASYEQNKNSKLWSVRFRETMDGVERQPRLSGFRTKKEAQAAYIEHIKASEEAAKLKPTPSAERMLFSILADSYLELQKARIKYSSYYTFKSKIDKNIKPFFDGQYVDEIKPADIIEWQKSISDYSYKYKTDLQARLTAIYIHGDRYYDIPNIMRKVEGFRKIERSKEMLFWSKDEFLKFIAQCDDLIYSTFFWLLYISGCRKGEVLALSWSDINLVNQTISITKSVTRKTENTAWEVTSTKNTPSERVIDIPPNLIARLKKYRDWQVENFKDTTFLFCGDHPLAERSIDRYFSNAIKLAEIKRIRIHDLRHSCASLLIAEGVSIVAVGKRLGHKDIEETLNTYSHLMPSDNSKMISVLNDIKAQY